MKSIINLVLGVFVASALMSATISATALAQPNSPEKSSIELSSVVEIEKLVKKADGTTAKERQAVKSALPGDEVLVLNRFKNVSQKPASNLVMTNPVPQNTQLVNAFGSSSKITYSIDGGKSFDAADKLSVKGSDGKPRPAKEDDFTHVRWLIAEAVAPGQAGEVGLRVRVK